MDFDTWLEHRGHLCQSCNSFNIKAVDEDGLCFRCEVHQGEDLGYLDPECSCNNNCEKFEPTKELEPLKECNLNCREPDPPKEPEVLPERRILWNRNADKKEAV